MRSFPEKQTRTPVELGFRPSPTSMIPALTSSLSRVERRKGAPFTCIGNSRSGKARHIASPCHCLDIFPYRYIMNGMPRAPTTSDVFNAIAEPRRRQIVELLARRGATAVGTLVVTL